MMIRTMATSGRTTLVIHVDGYDPGVIPLVAFASWPLIEE